jgi:hypothetical protein
MPYLPPQFGSPFADAAMAPLQAMVARNQEGLQRQEAENQRLREQLAQLEVLPL